MPAGPERAAATAGLALITAAGIVMLAAGLAGSFSFFGQGATEAFRRWTSQGLLWGGAVAAVAGAAGIAMAWLASQPAHPGIRRLGVFAAALVAVAAVVTGLVVHQQRSHPQGRERSALTRLAVQAGTAGRLTTGSIPAGRATVAGPPGLGPPVGVLSWEPAGCAALHAALAAWADPGSVRVPPGFTPPAAGPACLWFATYHGWPVRAEVLGPVGRDTGPGTGQPAGRVIIAPPEVGL